MAKRAQLGMFDELGDNDPRIGKIAPSEFSSSLRQLGQQLPQTLRMGTSSWSFPGWSGLVYDALYAPTALARSGLEAYVQHPLFRTVGIDRGFYAPIPRSDLERYADAAPNEFAFLTKAHAHCTQPVFPSQRRYGARAGQQNKDFLQAAYAREHVVLPLIESLGEKLGPILFQFSQMPLGQVGGPSHFFSQLDTFLGELPHGPRYAIELRNSELLRPEYRAILRRHGAIHCINLMPEMPSFDDQFRIMKAADQPELLVRWMLAPGLDYESAKQLFAPFDKLAAPNPIVRRRIAAMVKWAAGESLPTWIIVNNKAEGSSPLSIVELAHEIAEQMRLPGIDA